MVSWSGLTCRVKSEGWAGGGWLDELAGAVTDCADHAQAWREYEVRHREPADQGAYVAWVDAGPTNTARGAAFAVMSGGEQRLVRLVATLCPSVRVAWSVSDVGFDERGAAVLQDWLQIVHAQLPDWIYPHIDRMAAPEAWSGGAGCARDRGSGHSEGCFGQLTAGSADEVTRPPRCWGLVRHASAVAAASGCAVRQREDAAAGAGASRASGVGAGPVPGPAGGRAGGVGAINPSIEAEVAGSQPARVTTTASRSLVGP